VESSGKQKIQRGNGDRVVRAPTEAIEEELKRARSPPYLGNTKQKVLQGSWNLGDWGRGAGKVV